MTEVCEFNKIVGRDGVIIVPKKVRKALAIEIGDPCRFTVRKFIVPKEENEE